jgi:hypothetical protein
MPCLGSTKCEYAPRMVTLQDGCVVCSNCHLWALECEAKRLLTYPMPQRREGLVEREKIRGKTASEMLKDLMARIHEDRGKKAQKLLGGKDE